MVTSFTKEGALDEQGLIENIQFQKNANIKSICILGGTGEATSLTQQERFNVMEVTMKNSDGLQVIIGALVGNPNEVKEDIEQAKQIGAAACMVMAPPFVRPSEKDVQKYITEL